MDSFAQDLVHAVSRGSFLTEKHVLLGTGLHSLTGLKKPVQILGRFGHCCNYDKIRLIETAQAELAQHLRSLENPLPLLPAHDGDRVLIFFWWDNFDAKKANMQGSIHTTHGIAYQEESTNTVRAPLDEHPCASFKHEVHSHNCSFGPSKSPKERLSTLIRCHFL